MNPRIAAVTERIRARSAPQRQAYLARLQKLVDRPPGAQRMGCANVAHAFAGMPGDQRFKVVAERGTIYLMGRVTEREANRATELARATSGVGKVVKVFEILSEAELASLQSR